MATKDVLEALAAGAGRQSAIGGLMFQDAQKREARDYAAALEKEKYRRTGEATALKNARGGYKFAADKAFSAMESWKKAYIRAMKGQTGSEFEDGNFLSTGGTYTDDQIAEIKTNYLKSVEEYNYSRRKFFEYSGIGEEFKEVVPEDLDKIAGGTGTTKSKGKLAEMVNSVMVGHYINKFDDEGKVLQSPQNFETMMRQRKEGGEVDVNAIIGTINSGLEDIYLEKRKGAGYSGVLTDAEKKEAHLTSKQEQAARKMIMERLDEENKWAFETTRARDPYPTSPVDKTYSPQQALVTQGKVIEQGIGDQAVDTAGFNEAVGSEVQTRLAEQGAATDPSIRIANQVAADRAQQAAVDAKQQGMISSTEYKRAYTDAQQIITRMFTEKGNVTQKVFEAFLAEQGLKGIELMAYRQAFKDLTSYGGSMQRLQNQPSRFEEFVPPDEASGSALQQWWKPTKRGTGQLIDKYKSLHNR